jgi:ATP-dependent Clp protease ATP-binding subunit ClpC
MKTKTLGFTSGDEKQNWDRRAEKVRDELKNVFNPEFLNRLDDVIVFHPLNREHIAQIVTVLLKDVRKRLAEEELQLKLTDGATEFLVKNGYDEQYGARPLKRAIQKFIEDPLSEKILMGDFAKGDEIEVDVAPEGAERLDFRVLTSTTPQA